MTSVRALAIGLLWATVWTIDGTALAHHSYAATYRADQTIRIDGVVAMFMYRNPHSTLQVLVSDPDGKSYRWACEWAGTRALDSDGVSNITLKPGDKVIITGLPGRNPEDHRLLVKSIVRPADGWKWSGDSTR
jgi:hypothetical protein